jgi:hypothetical protein
VSAPSDGEAGTVQAEATESYYFFSNDVPAGKTLRQVIEDISHQPGVRFVAQFDGEHKIFGAVDHDTLEALQSAIAESYIPAGLLSTWVRLDTSSRIMAPKRGSPDYCAIVRVRTDGDPEEVLAAIDDRFEERYEDDEPDHRRFGYGACTVTGSDFEILVDLGADTHKEVVRSAKVDLGGVTGVLRPLRISTSFLPGNAKRPGDPDES